MILQVEPVRQHISTGNLEDVTVESRNPFERVYRYSMLDSILNISDITLLVVNSFYPLLPLS